MRRVLSTVLAVALLLGLGALAVLALPNANASLVGAPAVSAAAPEFAPDAPAVPVSKYNVVGMPLDAAKQFTDHLPNSLGFDSQGLADLIGPSVSQVLRWNAARQEFDTWNPDPANPGQGSGYVDGQITSTPFALAVGGGYWLLVDLNAPQVVSFVGDVPEPYTIRFTWNAGASGCSYNEFTIPLEQSTLTNVDALATSVAGTGALTNVQQVLQWNASIQQFDSWNPDPTNPNRGSGVYNGLIATTPWATRIGYPYQVCVVSALNSVMWP